MNLNKIIFLANTDYIFKIDNFLDREEFIKLYNNFPPPPVGTKNIICKKAYNSIDENFFNILKLNSEHVKFHNQILSKDFQNFFIKNLYFKILKYKLIFPNYLLKFLCKKNLETTYQYSYMPNNSFLNPHVDSNNKIISLMLYFPDKNSDKSENFKLKQRQIGTVFYRYAHKNFNNTEIINSKKFNSESEKIFTTPFEECVLYGFIKTVDSWHAVEAFNINQDYIRKSININIRINK